MTSTDHRKRYPELRRFDSREDAQVALQAWQWKLVKLPRFWFALFSFTIGIGLLVALIFVLLRQWFRIPMSLLGPIVGSVTSAPGTLATIWFWRRRCRRYLREQLIARGIPICLKCGYDLRGQVEPKCSECGTPCAAELITQDNHAK